MTVSGHMLYTFADNAMATRHREAVEDLPLSEEARAYLACNIELDRALERLIEALDASGELERTLFVVSPDHYPYGLEKSTIDELAGHEVDPNFEIYKSSLLIWSAAMEEPVVVDKLCSSLDILPTVLNLMGIDYDSRLLIGRDILSDAPALVIFADSSFISDACFYQATTQMVTPRIAGPIDWGYVNEILTAIANKFASRPPCSISTTTPRCPTRCPTRNPFLFQLRPPSRRGSRVFSALPPLPAPARCGRMGVVSDRPAARRMGPA